ncbi:MAG: SBBP repeat-containing protein [Planctomycetes bacterium]|nr:SBBP repeat-containing protein [Planctomycetota bacterium]
MGWKKCLGIVLILLVNVALFANAIFGAWDTNTSHRAGHYSSIGVGASGATSPQKAQNWGIEELSKPIFTINGHPVHTDSHYKSRQGGRDKPCLSASMAQLAQENSGGAGASGVPHASVQASYGKLPLYFIKNDGQMEEGVKFYEKGSGHAVFFTEEAVYLLLADRRQEARIEKQEARGERQEAGCRMQEVRGRESEGLPEKSSIRNPQPAMVTLVPLGANKHPEIVAEGLQEGKVNYFIGNQPEKWRTNIPTYGAVVYKEIYKGIDIKFYGNNRQLEYDIIVKPGADPSQVRFAYEGVEDLRMNEDGDLEIILADAGEKGSFGEGEMRRVRLENPEPVVSVVEPPVVSGEEVGWALPTHPDGLELAAEQKIIQKRPYVYQEINGKRVEIEGRFVIQDADPPAGSDLQSLYKFVHAPYPNRKSEIVHRKFSYGFHVAPYDTTRTIIIDPTLVYSVCIGGGNNEESRAIAVDGSGYVYIGGESWGVGIPKVGTSARDYSGNADGFVTKIGTSGATLVYSTYLGDGSDESVYGIAVDGTGCAYVTGNTGSPSFPIVGTTTSFGTESAAFVTKIGTQGANIVYSTFLTGDNRETGYAIAVDGSGCAYATGFTSSTNFPVVGTSSSRIGARDCFVTKIGTDSSSVTILYSTYIGGNNDDEAMGIAVDSAGSAYITGFTYSSNYPVAGTTTTFGGDQDVFVTKLDRGAGIAVDSTGAAYVTGYTSSGNYPIVGTTTPYGGNQDVFVTKLDTGTPVTIVYSTYLGGTTTDSGAGIAVDGSGSAYITGYTSSGNYPIVGTTTAYAGGEDTFFTRLGTGTPVTILYSTYVGGSSVDRGAGIAVDGSGSAYITGYTQSSNFPIVGTTTAYHGNKDVFVSKFIFTPSVTTGTATSITSTSATLNGTVSALGLSTTALFQYGTISNSYTGTSTTQSASGTSDMTVSLGISNLSPGTTFYYRIAASNSLGTSTGSEASFATIWDAPVATTSIASNITTSSATLNGQVSTNGTTTTAFFQYGTVSGSYTGTSTQSTVTGSSTSLVSASLSSLSSGTNYYYRNTSKSSVGVRLSGLSSGTTYYYRAVANNIGGTSTGSEVSFATVSPPSDSTPRVTLSVNSKNPASGESGVSVNATVSATFNMSVNGSTVTTESFKLSSDSGNVSGSVATDGAKITFTPSANFSHNTQYTATITTKVQAANAAGTSLDSNYSWSFTTASAPAASSPTPAASPSPTSAATAVPTPTATPQSSPVPSPSPTTPGVSGMLQLSKTVAYLSGDTVVVTVADADRDASATSEDTLTTAIRVTALNYYAGGELMLDMKETAVNSGTFLATIKTGTTTTGGADSGTKSNIGTFKTVQGGTATVVYTDTNPTASTITKTLAFSSSDATLAFDRVLYTIGEYAAVMHVDAEENTDHTKEETLLNHAVIETSSINRALMKLTETGADTGTFKGSILVSSTATLDNERIRASGGDTLTVGCPDEINTSGASRWVTAVSRVVSTAATPIPTPTATPTPSPASTATAIPTECIAESMALSSYNLNLKVRKSKEVIVTVTGSDGCLVEGDAVIGKAGIFDRKCVSFSPRKAITDANGQARFKIKGKRTNESVTVSFWCEEMKETIAVDVVK